MGTNNSCKTAAAFLLVLLYAGAADGLMEALGPGWFLAAGAAIMGVARVLAGWEEHDADDSFG